MKAELKSLFKMIFTNNYKHVIWIITNSCNCKCAMCGLWQKKSKSLDIEKAKKLVDFMSKNNVVYIQLTGGEPSLYKHLIPLIQYINKKGIVMQLATNGTMVTEENAGKMRKAGLKYICISLDHYKPEIHDSVRNYKGCFTKVLNAIKILKQEGFVMYSSSVINKYNYKDLETFVSFVNSLGIQFGGCFPYPDFNENDTISHLPENDLKNAVNELIDLKRKGYKIVNTYAYLKDCLRFIDGKKAKYPCLAGTRVVGLKVDEFRTCWMLKNLVFNLETGWKEQKIDCNECQLACFRESSIVTGLASHNKKELLKEILNFFSKPES